MNTTFSDLVHNQTIWIAGAAKSGIGAAKLLKKFAAKVFITDSSPITENNKKILNTLDIPFEENGHSMDLFLRECKLLVLSPAIMLNKSIALVAKQHNIPIISEIELTSWYLQEKKEAKVVAITGTNGKSTVTNYIAQLLVRGQKNATACGNIGFSFAEAAATTNNYFSLELSSYQLETTYSLRPHVTILLNLQKDHLARYGNMDEYLKAKWRLLLLTADDGFALVDAKTFLLGLKMGLPLPRAEVILLYPNEYIFNNSENIFWQKIEYGKTLPQALYGELPKCLTSQLAGFPGIGFAKYSLRNEQISVSIKSPRLQTDFAINSPCLLGEHNVQNLLAGSVAGLALQLPLELIVQQWEKSSSTYTQIPHRMEIIGGENAYFLCSNQQKKQLWIVNDSKATNVESTIVALKSYQKPLRLLIGGDPKGEKYAPIAENLAPFVQKIYPFGKAGAAINAELSLLCPGKINPALNSLFSAAELALAESNSGDIILLSPACASFDEFKNFEQRGDLFREWALNKIVHNT